jgi:hypothetical protein
LRAPGTGAGSGLAVGENTRCTGGSWTIAQPSGVISIASGSGGHVQIDAVALPPEPQEHAPHVTLPGHRQNRAHRVGERARRDRARHLAARHEVGEAPSIFGDQPVCERRALDLEGPPRTAAQLNAGIAVAAVVLEKVRVGRDRHQAGALVVILAETETVEVELGAASVARASLP